MAANMEMQRVKEWNGLRGFSNLFRKENRDWWQARLWWINALVWPIILCGLMAEVLFVAGNLVGGADFTSESERLSYITQTGLSVFFEFGSTALAIGIIVMTNGLIVGEKNNGVTEWLLSKPLARRSYILAKTLANALVSFILLIVIPSGIAYALLFIRGGALYPWSLFLSAVGIMTLHTMFYLALTIALGTFFNSRGPILGIALGFVLGGSILGSIFKPLLSVTPWTLSRSASLISSNQSVPADVLWPPMIATAILTFLLIIIATTKFTKTDF